MIPIVADRHAVLRYADGLGSDGRSGMSHAKAIGHLLHTGWTRDGNEWSSAISELSSTATHWVPDLDVCVEVEDGNAYFYGFDTPTAVGSLDAPTLEAIAALCRETAP